MSWSNGGRGTAQQVSEQAGAAIKQSASYDPTLEAKATAVADATQKLIESAASDVPEGKEVSIWTSGHLDHNGMSSYSLSVGFVDPEPEVKPVTEEQFAAASGTAAE